MLFRPKQKQIKKHLNFRLRGKTLDETETLKYLGITFDQNLTWKPHINKLAAKLSRATGLLSRIHH